MFVEAIVHVCLIWIKLLLVFQKLWTMRWTLSN